MNINELLKVAVENKASDLHLKVGSHPVARIDGSLHSLAQLKRLMQQRHRLGQVNNVDVVAGAVNERRHLWVPAMGLMAEMDPSLEELAHRNIGQCHGTASLLFPVLPPRGERDRQNAGHRSEHKEPL